MSATFWNIRRRKAAQKAAQEVAHEVTQEVAQPKPPKKRATRTTKKVEADGN